MEYFHIYILSLILFIVALIILIISFINEKTSVPHILFWLGFLPAVAAASTYTCYALWSELYTSCYRGSMQAFSEALLMGVVLLISIGVNFLSIIMSGIAAFKGRLYRMWFVPLVEGITFTILFLLLNNNAVSSDLMLVFLIQGLASAGIAIAMAVLALYRGNIAITGIGKPATASLWFSLGGFAFLFLVLLAPLLQDNYAGAFKFIARNMEIALALGLIICFTGAIISLRSMAKKFSRSDLIGLVILMVLVALGPLAINITAWLNSMYRLFYIPHLIIALGLMIFLVRRHDLEKVTRISLYTGVMGSALMAFSAESIFLKFHS